MFHAHAASLRRAQVGIEERGLAHGHGLEDEVGVGVGVPTLTYVPLPPSMKIDERLTMTGVPPTPLNPDYNTPSLNTTTRPHDA